MTRGKPIEIDLPKFGGMHARGLSDTAIARVLGCCRWTVANYRHRMGLTANFRPNRRQGFRARHAELDAIWARLTIEEKRRLLLNR